ncbi:MAG: MotA/TolQ/ExbB proton channel family protein, partial [Pirellulales bacterium]|nr:MotA/TolQ/ExbB proton channel family protein [Pirellulales bacterium]
MNTPNRLAQAVFRSALLWGLLAALAFYAPLRAGLWHHPLLQRYFMGHWVEYVETALFCVGLAALVLKAVDNWFQARALHDPLVFIDDTPRSPQELLAALRSLPEDRRNTLLANRLREALEAVVRRGSADRVDQDLQYLAEADAARAQSGYALVRIIVWAIPILGFLGTVIGITLAIASLSPQALEESLPAVTGGLGTAFDTTALALALSMVLMFVQFVVERMETRLLARVDKLAAQRLASLMEPADHGDIHTGAVRRMAEAVIKASERLVQRQAELWQASLQAAHERWTRMADASRQQLEAALEAALRGSLEAHARALAERQGWMVPNVTCGAPVTGMERFALRDPENRCIQCYWGTDAPATASEVLRISHIVLNTTKIEEIAEFYCELLQLKISDWTGRQMVF